MASEVVFYSSISSHVFGGVSFWDVSRRCVLYLNVLIIRGCKIGIFHFYQFFIYLQEYFHKGETIVCLFFRLPSGKVWTDIDHVSVLFAVLLWPLSAQNEICERNIPVVWPPHHSFN